MTAPHLSRLLTLESPNRLPDGAGGVTTAWTALGTLWAEVSPGDARPQATPGGAVAEGPLRIVVRGSPRGAPSRPRPGQRFRDGGAVYSIVSVQEDDALGRFLRCAATEEGAL